jgi:phage anti-repressor protein
MEFSHERAIALVRSTEDFPVDFDDAWQWIGYSTKQMARKKLNNNFEHGVDFLIKGLKSSQGGRSSEHIVLTIDCFKSLGMMAGTQKGKEIRHHFLDCERQLKEVLLSTAPDPIATAFSIADHFRSLLANAGIDPAIATLIGLKYIERQLPQLKPEVEESRELIGKHHASDSHYLTPTELGQQTGKKAKDINIALELAGFQVKKSDGKHTRWDLTDTGKNYGKVFLAAAQTSRWSGGQVKWKPDVLQILGLEVSHV